MFIKDEDLHKQLQCFTILIAKIRFFLISNLNFICQNLSPLLLKQSTMDMEIILFQFAGRLYTFREY